MELRGLDSSVLAPVDGEEDSEEASAAVALDVDDREVLDTGDSARVSRAFPFPGALGLDSSSPL